MLSVGARRRVNAETSLLQCGHDLVIREEQVHLLHEGCHDVDVRRHQLGTQVISAFHRIGCDDIPSFVHYFDRDVIEERDAKEGVALPFVQRDQDRPMRLGRCEGCLVCFESAEGVRTTVETVMFFALRLSRSTRYWQTVPGSRSTCRVIGLVCATPLTL